VHSKAAGFPDLEITHLLNALIALQPAAQHFFAFVSFTVDSAYFLLFYWTISKYKSEI